MNNNYNKIMIKYCSVLVLQTVKCSVRQMVSGNSIFGHWSVGQTYQTRRFAIKKHRKDGNDDCNVRLVPKDAGGRTLDDYNNVASRTIISLPSCPLPLWNLARRQDDARVRSYLVYETLRRRRAHSPPGGAFCVSPV